MLTRDQIVKQIEELIAENQELSGMLDDPTYGNTNREIMGDNNKCLELLQYTATHATDDDICLAQIALPGRVGIFSWAKRQFKF